MDKNNIAINPLNKLFLYFSFLFIAILFLPINKTQAYTLGTIAGREFTVPITATSTYVRAYNSNYSGHQEIILDDYYDIAWLSFIVSKEAPAIPNADLIITVKQGTNITYAETLGSGTYQAENITENKAFGYITFDTNLEMNQATTSKLYIEFTSTSSNVVIDLWGLNGTNLFDPANLYWLDSGYINKHLMTNQSLDLNIVGYLSNPNPEDTNWITITSPENFDWTVGDFDYYEISYKQTGYTGNIYSTIYLANENSLDIINDKINSQTKQLSGLDNIITFESIYNEQRMTKETGYQAKAELWYYPNPFPDTTRTIIDTSATTTFITKNWEGITDNPIKIESRIATSTTEFYDLYPTATSTLNICGEFGLFASTTLDVVFCNLENFLILGSQDLASYSSDKFEFLFNQIQLIFPIRQISLINTAINNVQATTTQAVMTLGGNNTFGGRTITLNLASSLNTFETNTTFSFRNLISKILYALTGIIILIQSIVMIKSLSGQNSNENNIFNSKNVREYEKEWKNNDNSRFTRL